MIQAIDNLDPTRATNFTVKINSEQTESLGVCEVVWCVGVLLCVTLCSNCEIELSDMSETYEEKLCQMSNDR